jgi:hypothetical protein
MDSRTIASARPAAERMKTTDIFDIFAFFSIKRKCE